MSRKTVRWRRVVGTEWSDRNRRTHRAGNGGSVDAVLPTRVAHGSGRWLGKGQGRGNVCSLPMSPEKEERVRKLFANSKRI